MAQKKKKLLLIEDDKVDQMAFKRFASKKDFAFDYNVSSSVTEAKKLLSKNKYDIIVSDYFLGDGTAFDILFEYKDMPLVITTGTGDEEIAVEAMKKGAFDYLIKDVEGYYLKVLPVTLENAINRFHAEQQLNAYHKNLEKLVEERTVKLNEEITERKKIEKDLIENQTHLQTLVNTLPDLVWMKDENGVYITCNRRFEQFFGAPLSEISGKTDYDFVDKELADFFRQKDKEAIEAGKPSRNEEEVEFAEDGHHEILETIKTPMFDENNELVGVLGIGRDITARKKAEQELNKYREHLEELVEKRTSELEKVNKELEDKNQDLERFNDLFVGREFRIKELRDLVKKYEEKFGKLA